MTHCNVNVVTAEVRRSADQMDAVAEEASSSRSAVADSVSTQGTGWKEKGTPGFGKFAGILEAQAERLRTDLTDVYDKQDNEAGGALDSSVR